MEDQAFNGCGIGQRLRQAAMTIAAAVTATTVPGAL